jgi:Mg2+ and Co2+ transporter CorA
LINKETNDEIIGKFETEIISENKIKELEDELVKSNIERDSAYDKISEVNHENMQLKSIIKDLENQLKKKNRKDQALF